MYILQIEHPVQDFNSWKKVFDSDPADRQQSGVRRYRVQRKADDPNYIIIDLEFDSLSEAENFHSSLRKLWTSAEGKIMMNPQTRIIEMIERKEY